MIIGAVCVGIVAVLWFPPILQQLRKHPGNLTATSDWFRHTNEPGHTLVDGFHVVTAQFGIRPEWLTARRSSDFVTGETVYLHNAPVPWLLLVIAAATYVCWRRRDRTALRFAFVIWFALVVGVVALARVPGPMYEYRIHWTWLVAMAASILVALTVWKIVQERFPSAASRLLVPAALVAIAAVSAASIVGAARSGDLQEPVSGIVGRVARDVKPALPLGPGDVVVDRVDAFFGTGVVMELERQGVHVRVASDPVHRFGDGEQRIHSDAPVRAFLYVAADGDLDELSQRSDVKLLSYWGTLPVDEREHLVSDIKRREHELDVQVYFKQLTMDEFLVQRDRLRHTMPSIHGTSLTALGVFMQL